MYYRAIVSWQLISENTGHKAGDLLVPTMHHLDETLSLKHTIVDCGCKLEYPDSMRRERHPNWETTEVMVLPSETPQPPVCSLPLLNHHQLINLNLDASYVLEDSACLGSPSVLFITPVEFSLFVNL